MSFEIRNLVLVNATSASIRVAKFQQRDHIVVPTVGMVEGVVFPVNAQSPEFVPRDTLAKAPEGWNGRPVFLNHPEAHDGTKISGNDPRTLETSLGLLFNTTSPQEILQTGKLTFESWLDSQRNLVEGAQDIFERAQKGEPIEVSVGAHVLLEHKSGVFNGRPYKAIWREIVPVHLAMLQKGDTGACSVRDGCGAPRTASRHFITASGISVVEDKMADDNKEGDKVKTLKDKLKSLMDSLGLTKYAASAEDMSDVDLRQSLDRSLRASEPGFLEVVRVYPEKGDMVYAVAPGDEVMLYRREYAVSTSGEVTLGKDRTLVQPETQFVPVTAAAAGCGCKKNKETVMHRNAQRIKALIDNPKSAFASADQTYLEGLDDARLESFEKALPAEEKKKEEVIPVVAAKEGEKTQQQMIQDAVKAAMPQTDEDWFKLAPQSVKAAATRLQAQEAAQKEALIGSLKTAQKVYSEEALKAMEVPDLQKLADLVGLQQSQGGNVDYGVFGHRAAEKKEDRNPPPAPSVHARFAKKKEDKEDKKTA